MDIFSHVGSFGIFGSGRKQNSFKTEVIDKSIAIPSFHIQIYKSKLKQSAFSVMHVSFNAPVICIPTALDLGNSGAFNFSFLEGPAKSPALWGQL